MRLISIKNKQGAKPYGERRYILGERQKIAAEMLFLYPKIPHYTMQKNFLPLLFLLLFAACKGATEQPKDGEGGKGKPALSLSRDYSKEIKSEIYPADTAKVGADGFSYVYPDTFERLEDPQLIPFGDGYAVFGSWRRLKVISDEDYLGGDEPVEQIAGEKQLLLFDAAGKLRSKVALDPYFGYRIAPFSAEKSIAYEASGQEISLLDMKTGATERPVSVNGAISGVASINTQSFAVLYGKNGAYELDILYGNLQSTLQQKSRIDSAWLVYALCANEKIIATTFMGNLEDLLIAFSPANGKELWRINLPKRTSKGEDQRMAGKNNVAISPLNGNIALLTHRQLPSTRSQSIVSLYSPNGKLLKEQIIALEKPKNDDINLIASRIQALPDGSWLIGGTHYPEKGFNHGWGEARLSAELEYIGGRQIENGENYILDPKSGQLAGFQRRLIILQ